MPAKKKRKVPYFSEHLNNVLRKHKELEIKRAKRYKRLISITRKRLNIPGNKPLTQQAIEILISKKIPSQLFDGLQTI